MQFCKTKSAADGSATYGSFLTALAQTNTTSLTGDVQDATGAAMRVDGNLTNPRRV